MSTAKQTRAQSRHQILIDLARHFRMKSGANFQQVAKRLAVATDNEEYLGQLINKNKAAQFIEMFHHKIVYEKSPLPLIKLNINGSSKPQTASKKRYIRKTSREEMARFFGCSKYSSTLILGQMVAKHLELPVPGTKAESVRLVVERYKDVLNSGRPAEGGKLRGGSGDEFYKSNEWRELRYSALRNCEGRCQCCGATAADGEQIHVDHIKPRSKYPELALDLDNLGVLCGSCNVGKSNYYEDDWRGLTSY